MEKRKATTVIVPLRNVCLLLVLLVSPLAGQERVSPALDQVRAAEIQLGSRTAKGGFANEDAVRDKFNCWQTDKDARDWLEAMHYSFSEIEAVEATKPHGMKADVEVHIRTKSSSRSEGISLKLVSTPHGFNQIDKRWLRTYAKMWSIPPGVEKCLQRFVGEMPPDRPTRNPDRMFLDELDEVDQQAVVQFFLDHRERILKDLFIGEGDHRADWFMVTLADEKWELCSSAEAAAFFGEGPVELTPGGSLKIGRITMQRKGGDNGRDTANMLQFKINPVELFQRPRTAVNSRSLPEIGGRMD